MRSAADLHHRILAEHRREQQREADRWYLDLLDAVRREAHRKTLRRRQPQKGTTT